MKITELFTRSLKILLTLLLLFFVFRSVDISEISHDLKSINLKLLVLLLVVCWTGQLLCSARWRLFATSLQMQGSYFNFVRIYFIGMFFNIGLPSLVGGDVIKAYLISNASGKPLQTGLVSVLQDRGVGLISLLIYGSIAILLSPISWRGFPLGVAYLFIWIALACFLLLAFKGGKWVSRLLVVPAQTLFQKTMQSLAELHQTLGKTRLTPGAFFRITCYSFIYSGLVLLVFHQVTVAAGNKVGIVSFSALFPLITVATMLPITISGMGIREWLYVEALSLIGMPRDAGLVISLATSALFLLCNLAGIIFLFGTKPLDWKSFLNPGHFRDMNRDKNSGL
jgi:glycosyltransferase 2 family protein